MPIATEEFPATASAKKAEENNKQGEVIPSKTNKSVYDWGKWKLKDLEIVPDKIEYFRAQFRAKVLIKRGFIENNPQPMTLINIYEENESSDLYLYLDGKAERPWNELGANMYTKGSININIYIDGLGSITKIDYSKKNRIVYSQEPENITIFLKGKIENKELRLLGNNNKIVKTHFLPNFVLELVEKISEFNLKNDKEFHIALAEDCSREEFSFLTNKEPSPEETNKTIKLILKIVKVFPKIPKGFLSFLDKLMSVADILQPSVDERLETGIPVFRYQFDQRKNTIEAEAFLTLTEYNERFY